MDIYTYGVQVVDILQHKTKYMCMYMYKRSFFLPAFLDRCVLQKFFVQQTPKVCQSKAVLCELGECVRERRKKTQSFKLTKIYFQLCTKTFFKENSTTH